MKVISFNKLGNPADVLEVIEQDAPALNAGEIRVDVLATPIHPSHLLSISGLYGISPELPQTPGSEGVGRVVEVAEDVQSITVGQTVLLPGYGGTWAQQITGLAATFIPLPDADPLQLSMLTINPITAFLMLKQFVNLKKGDWLIQSAANSAVGSYLVQLAKQRGLKSVNIVRRNSAVKGVRDLGGDVVLVDGDDLVERIATATNNAAISLAIDAVGGETFTRLAESLTIGGGLVAYGAMSMKEPLLSARLLIFNDIRVRGFWLTKWFEKASTTDKQAVFAEIIPLIATGTIKAKIDSTYTLDQIKEAVTAASESGRDGKVLLIPNG